MGLSVRWSLDLRPAREEDPDNARREKKDLRPLFRPVVDVATRPVGIQLPGRFSPRRLAVGIFSKIHYGGVR